MRSMAQILLLTAGVHALSVPAKSFLPNFLSRSPSPAQQQQPIMNIPIPIPGSSNNKKDEPCQDSDGLIISDVIGKESSINIFAGFTRTFYLWRPIPFPALTRR